jgi:Ca2+-binding RTX toxin-like protein
MLDLNEGGRSNIGVAVAASGNVGGVPMSTSYTQTLSIAFGARVEHAVGTPAADVLVGNALANRLQGGGGDDRIDGGAGVDTAVFAGPRSAYVITHRSGAIQVADTLAGRDGTDSLVGVERLAFSDAALAFDAGGGAGAAYRLYQAAFGRAAEPSGLGYWMAALDRGAAQQEVAAGFTHSQEFAIRYGSADLPGFVTQLYANVLHRAPDEGGLAFHVGTLASGAADRPQVLVNFSESPENQAALVGTIEQGVVYV